MAFRRPLDEHDQRHEYGLQPSAIFHLLGRQPNALASGFQFRQIGARAPLRLQALKPLNSFSRDAGVNPFRVRPAYISFPLS